MSQHRYSAAQFSQKPLLEQEQWADRKDLSAHLLENAWDTPCR